MICLERTGVCSKSVMSRSFLDRESVDFLDEESSHFFGNMSARFLDTAARAETQGQSREAHVRSARRAQGTSHSLPALQASVPAEQRSSQRIPPPIRSVKRRYVDLGTVVAVVLTPRTAWADSGRRDRLEIVNERHGLAVKKRDSVSKKILDSLSKKYMDITSLL